MRLTTYKTELNEELHNVLIKENSCDYPCDNLNNPDKIVNMLNAVYRLNRQAEEHLYMLALNTNNKILGMFEVSHGTVNCSICNPRDIFIKALLCGATYIILAHNHPSQDTKPSKDDLHICKRVSEVGKMIGIELLDNLIVGAGYYSFRENNIIA